MSIGKLIKDLVLQGDYVTHSKGRGSKIIYYHDLFDKLQHQAYTDMATPIEKFKEHLNVISDCGFEIVSGLDKSEGQILIAFDDGWKGIYDFKDCLAKNNILPTVSLAIGLVGLDGYLNKKQIKELFFLGFKFASHSWTHQSMTLYNNDEKALRRELFDSKDFLEDLLSTEINTFCYPKGIFSKTIYEKTLEYGYKNIFSCVDGNYSEEVFPYVRRRCFAQISDNKELKWMLLGQNSMMAKRHFKQQYKFDNF